MLARIETPHYVSASSSDIFEEVFDRSRKDFDTQTYLQALKFEERAIDPAYQHAQRLLRAGKPISTVLLLSKVEDFKQEKIRFDYDLVTSLAIPASEILRLMKGQHRFGLLDMCSGRKQNIQFKVVIPEDNYRENYVGRIIGQKGSVLKDLQEKTDTRMSILGAGSMKDRMEEQSLLESGELRYQHFNEGLHVHIDALATLPEALHNIANAVEKLQPLLQPQRPVQEPVTRGRGRGMRERGSSSSSRGIGRAMTTNSADSLLGMPPGFETPSALRGRGDVGLLGGFGQALMSDGLGVQNRQPSLLGEPPNTSGQQPALLELPPYVQGFAQQLQQTQMNATQNIPGFQEQNVPWDGQFGGGTNFGQIPAPGSGGRGLLPSPRTPLLPSRGLVRLRGMPMTGERTRFNPY